MAKTYKPDEKVPGVLTRRPGDLLRLERPHPSLSALLPGDQHYVEPGYNRDELTPGVLPVRTNNIVTANTYTSVITLSAT